MSCCRSTPRPAATALLLAGLTSAAQLKIADPSLDFSDRSGRPAKVIEAIVQFLEAAPPPPRPPSALT